MPLRLMAREEIEAALGRNPGVSAEQDRAIRAQMIAFIQEMAFRLEV
jgi:hypothetical protein